MAVYDVKNKSEWKYWACAGIMDTDMSFYDALSNKCVETNMELLFHKHSTSEGRS